MISRLIKDAVITTAVSALLVVSQVQVMAGEWIFKPGTDGGPHLWVYHHTDNDYYHLSNTTPARPHPRNVAYSVSLHNPTKWTIGYSLNDQNGQRLKPGESVKWTVMGSKENPALFKITFDNGEKTRISYQLNNNADFDFSNKGKGVDLYKRKNTLYKR